MTSNSKQSQSNFPLRSKLYTLKWHFNQEDDWRPCHSTGWIYCEHVRHGVTVLCCVIHLHELFSSYKWSFIRYGGLDRTRVSSLSSSSSPTTTHSWPSLYFNNTNTDRTHIYKYSRHHNLYLLFFSNSSNGPPLLVAYTVVCRGYERHIVPFARVCVFGVCAWMFNQAVIE